MNSSKTWNVRPSRFPFGVSVEIVGVVSGTDRQDAQRKAEDLYGRNVVVELVHSSNGSERNSVSRQNGIGAGRPPTRGLQDVQSPVRDMTADEAQMARAAACCRLIGKSEHRPTIRMLHARSLSANRTISEAEAQLLRACVLAFAPLLTPEIVAMATVQRSAGGAP